MAAFRMPREDRSAGGGLSASAGGGSAARAEVGNPDVCVRVSIERTHLQGHATLGRIGFAGRADYTAIGSVTNLAARLCAEAQGRQILISQRVHAAIQDVVVADSVGELALRGFSRPARAYNVVGLDEARARL